MSLNKTEIKTYQNFIDGEWVDGSSKEFYQVFSPANKNEIVGNFPLSTERDVEKAVYSAHRQFKKWKCLGPSERAEYIYRFIEILDKNKERLAEAATKEQGKVYKEALSECTRGIKELRIVAGEGIRLEGIARPSDSKRTTNVAERVPIGVIAAITPWNFPILTPLRKIAPALVAGCTVVLKPASNTPLSSVIIAELFEKAGLPPGTLNLVIGEGKKVGEALVSNPLVKGVTFTGSTSVGRQINKIAAANFTKVQLEMGGKNAAVVANYKDLSGLAPQIVKAAYTNAGQRCTAISRVIVLENQAEELENLIVDSAKKLKIGNGMDPQVDMGPLINQNAVETMEKYVELAKQEGAKIKLGGKKLTGGIYDNGHYFEPTVITNVTQDMRIAKEEIFGPILAIIRVSSYEEAIEVCNNTEYGLTASVFTDDIAFSYDFTQNVEVGMVRVNNLGVSGGNMPFGGVKNSGLGPFGIGSTTMDFYTNMKVIYISY
ncbi:MAG: aldehyde dehydrogenase [Thermoanaerobacteraceae bacterium]|nr:aldehyde dehydrogenase [Thermoanaerobacteraceae bacterium]